jgi:hypothetical protein
MASKLNLGIKEAHDRPEQAVENVGHEILALESDLKAKVVTVQKSKVPFIFKFKTRSAEFLRNHKADVKYLLLGIPVIATFAAVAVLKNTQTIKTKAGLHQASVSFQLTSWSLPPQNTFGVWINSDSPVAFSDVELSFDPKSVKLSKEIVPKTSLTRKIKVTSMADANSTGKISIVLGLDPAMSGNPPSGAFQIADLTFDSNTSSQNVVTKIVFTNSGMQIVAVDQSVFNLTSTGIDLTINKTNPTPLPTSKPTPGPIVVPTSISVSTPTPTPVATFISKPSVNPTAKSLPIVTPPTQ